MDHAARSAESTVFADRLACEAPEAAAIVRLDMAIWALIAAVGAIVALSIPIGGFRLVWSSFAMPAATFAVLTVAAWFYIHIRSDRRLASTLSGTAQIIA